MPSRPVRTRLTGPATRSGAAAAGISAWQLRHRDVARLSRDTYLPRAALTDLHVRAQAVSMTAPEGAVISHHSAAALWGLAVPLQDRSDRRVHITVATGSAVRARADRVVHRIPLVPDDVVERIGLRMTTPPRTWRDLAAVLPPPALLAVTDQLLQFLCTADDLDRELTRRPTGRGSARARLVLPEGDARSESPMESVLRWILRAAGLPRPDLQYVVQSASGEFLGRADMAWPARKVLVEFDGDLHRERGVFVADLRRQNRLVAEGWVILRFTSADVLGRSDHVIATIQRALCL